MIKRIGSLRNKYASLTLIGLLLVSSFVTAQGPLQKINGSGFEWNRGKFKSLIIPKDTPAVPAAFKQEVQIGSKDNVFYLWSPTLNRWVAVQGSGSGGVGAADTTSWAARFAGKVDKGATVLIAELPLRVVSSVNLVDPDTLTINYASASQPGILSASNFTNFLAGYNKRITAVVVTGGTTKTVTLTHADNTTTTTTFTDLTGGGSSSITLADSTFRLTGDALSFRLSANPITFGADPTGVASANAAFTAAFATGLPVVVPRGAKFRLLNFSIPAGGILYGYGDSSIIINEANDRAVIPQNNVKIDNIHFVGPGKNAGLSFNTGIFLYLSIGWEVTRCRFTGFSGAAASNGGGGIYATNLAAQNSDGGRLSDLYFDQNNGGLVINGRAEYITATNITAGGNNVGVAIAAGNTVINGGHLHNNGVGLKLYDGPNNGHGTVSDVTINHNIVNIDASDIAASLGFTLNNIQAYYGTMKFLRAHNIRFNGGQISEIDSVSVNNSTGIQMNNIFWGTNTAGTGPIPVNVYNGGNDITFFGSDKATIKGELHLPGTIGSSTNSVDSILVKNNTTKRVELIPQSRFGGGGSYTLPIATAGVLGGVRIGSGFSIDPATGVVSVVGGGGGYTRSDSILSGGNVTINGALIANGQSYFQNTMNVSTGAAVGLQFTNAAGYEMYFAGNQSTNIHSAATTIGMYFSTSGAPIHFGNTDGGEMLKLSGGNLATFSVPVKFDGNVSIEGNVGVGLNGGVPDYDFDIAGIIRSRNARFSGVGGVYGAGFGKRLSYFTSAGELFGLQNGTAGQVLKVSSNGFDIEWGDGGTGTIADGSITEAMLATAVQTKLNAESFLDNSEFSGTGTTGDKFKIVKDATPTAASVNPVQSGGVKTALDTKQNTLSLTTTGTGAASLINDVLNIPTNSGTGGGGMNSSFGRAMLAMGSTTRATTVGLPPGFPLLGGAGGAYGSPMYETEMTMVAVYLDSAATLNGARYHLFANNAYTSTAYNGVALYKDNGSGTLTLVASSTNDATVFQGAVGVRQKNFSTTYAAAAGLYYVGLLFNGTPTVAEQQPQLTLINGGYSAVMNATMFSNGRFITGRIYPGGSLPSSVTASAVSSGQNDPVWVQIY